jgi:hypothetical protein
MIEVVEPKEEEEGTYHQRKRLFSCLKRQVRKWY